MQLVWLAWYISGACLLLALCTLLITYTPEVQHVGEVLPVVFSGGAVLAGGIAGGLGRLPTTHWIHRSKPVWALFLVAALTVTMLLAIIG